MSKPFQNQDEIEMVNRDGIFVPAKSSRVAELQKPKARKAVNPRPLNSHTEISNIVGGIVTDILKMIRKEMFR